MPPKIGTPSPQKEQQLATLFGNSAASPASNAKRQKKLEFTPATPESKRAKLDQEIAEYQKEKENTDKVKQQEEEELKQLAGSWGLA